VSAPGGAVGPGERELALQAPAGPVSALLLRPAQPRFLYVLAHGAGAGMRHPFLATVARALATRGVATLRYQFPYLERRRGRPDPPHVLEQTVRAALAEAARRLPGLPLFAGGKSMGGRMTSQAVAHAGDAPASVSGLVFLGFPLHPPRQPDDRRGQHLDAVPLPMLFLQGTRDELADLDRIRALTERLGGRATLHVVEDADHAFHVRKRTGRTDAAVLEELADVMADWFRLIAK